MIEAERLFFEALAPSPSLRLAKWIEGNIHLPEGGAAPGAMRLWPYQVGIADAIGDPVIERVTLVKPVRVGFTSLLTAAIGAYVVNDPSAILVLLPTEADCRDYVVSDIEPTFVASPALAKALSPATVGNRDTLLSRRFAGGSLKVVAARAPRNLRRHTAKVLLCDEVDAMEIGEEGSSLRLAERRTLTFNNRKIVIGSTPIFVDSSAVLKAYGESDKRIFEVPCPSCGAFTEIMWANIVWPEGEPGAAMFECPACKEKIDERHKARMVGLGCWRATRPEVLGHAGFRLNALVSLLANASWAKLAAEFLQAKDDPSELQTFVNTILGQGWSTPSLVDAGAVSSRAEPFDLQNIPAEVICVTCGCDVHDDRIEASLVGWTKDAVACVLSHGTIWGSFQDQATWTGLDELLRSTWRHPHGGRLKVDACCIDASDGDHYRQVLNFTTPRIGRKIFAIKSMAGARPPFLMAKGKSMAERFAIVGSDNIKNAIFDRLQRARGLRFSHNLPEVYYEQLASERRIVRQVRGMPKRQFVRVGRVRNESLDCLCYAWGAKESFHLNVEQRLAQLRGQTVERRSIASQLAGTGRLNTGPPKPAGRILDRNWK